MQKSSTRLKNSWHIWVARILGIGIVLVSIWANIVRLPETLRYMKHDGWLNDLFWRTDEKGDAVVYFVSKEAAQQGVKIGDKVLNPQDTVIGGEIGTPVAVYLQTGNEPLRLVTFTRRPMASAALGGTFLGVPTTISTNLAVLILVVPLIFASVASLLLCWLKSDDWMALLTAVAIVCVIGLPGNGPFFFLLGILSVPLIFLWLILFPNGKFLPRGAWLVLLLLELPGMLLDVLRYWGWQPLVTSSSLEAFQNMWLPLRAMASLTTLVIIAYRYKHVYSPLERQQSKWVLIPVLIGICPMVIVDLLSPYYWNLQQFDTSYAVSFLSALMRAFLTVMVIVGILLSVFQYRLYDIDVFVGRAIVYSSLTGILGLLGVLLTPLIDYILKQTFGEQTGLLAVLVSALPIAALFNPVRERLQTIVDRRFKQEEFDFQNTFIEFTSELSGLFTIKELSTLLSRHAVEQLDVSYASVFLNGQNGNLKHIKTTSLAEEASAPALDSKTVERIKNGQLASPDGDYSQSLVIPLVVPRSRKPSLLGVLVLGPRLQGVGYSTAMVKNLKKFGEEVGKAFYAAEVKSKKEQITDGKSRTVSE